MSYVDLSPGDRIRLVMFSVTDANNDQHRVNLRYSWTDAEPEHVCRAAECDYCAAQIERVLGKRLGHDVTVTATILMRDKQTTVRDTVPSIPAAA
jgi:hypothetical protein